MICVLSALEPEGVDMGVMAYEEDFSQRHHGLAEMHPIREDLIARIELFPCLGIERIQSEIADRGGTVLSR